MARSPDTTHRLNQLAGRALAGMISLVRRTSKIVYEPENALQKLAADHPLIVAVWHGQFMLTSGFRPGPDVKVAAMVARHGDAELIGAAMERLGVELIRGAGAGGRRKDRGGVHALRQAVRSLKDGYSLVMTADVPPGPARRAGEGIVTIARMSGRPIVPCAVASSRFRSLDTWSRLTINLPASKIAYVAGDPIWVSADAGEAELEFARQQVERSLNAVTKRAYQIVGADIRRATPLSLTEPDAPPADPDFRLKTYRTTMSMLRPFAPLILKVRERSGKEDPRRRGERLGHASIARPTGALCWVHAASVGETNAVLPVIETLSAARPDLHFLLTTGTVTSAGLAERRLGPNAIHQYVPLDAPQYAARFLEHWRPDLAVFTESEIWPSLILETSRREIPIALVNARLSHRSRRRWQRNKSMAVPLFSRFNIILAQNDRMALGFSALGARNVVSVGNLKIDAPPPPIDLNELERLKAALGDRPVFAAASTHEGEEESIAVAHRALARSFEGLCTIIAPRHPERGTALAEMLKNLGFTVAQRSTGALPGPRTEIYIADTIGELGTLYALAPIAFIGGSLVERGGQNPIEAVRHGAAVLTGPHWQNFRDAYRTLLRHEGAIEVKSSADIAAAVLKLLDNPIDMQNMRDGATRALDTLSGALDKTVEALLRYLPDERLKRAS
ncbi:glycosyltransferase N-terminal domain-containing protein [Hyphomicrobium sp. NDB2Meth4]|uniref:glycosyltransferase N-terminal domain-containing protein n=1 Tax=Hyphomicrobium sp. NDB2Meth4 TaxID=1892846 RepID=UPI000930AB42|nr:glycosyltransferase N-terminal domain-containing protein [Hyphomicrobium sp. NDB2Meth4]